MPSSVYSRRYRCTRSAHSSRAMCGSPSPHKARPPRLGGTGIRLVRFSGAAFSYGVQGTKFEDVPARITSPARTIVDCFRFERLIGREAAIVALQDAVQDNKVTTDDLRRVLGALPSRRLSAILEAGVL